MKRFMLIGISALALMAMTLTQVSYAQEDPTGKPQNRGQVKPNFVDEDGDGICDNQGTSGGNGTGICDGTGQGQGKGQGKGLGNGTHQRLRDGSCGQTPVQDGTGAANAAKGRKGRNAAPAK